MNVPPSGGEEGKGAGGTGQSVQRISTSLTPRLLIDPA